MIRLVDTSAWIEWLIGSPTGAVVGKELPERGEWLVPTIVQVLDPCSDKARGGLLRRLHADDDCDACGPQCVFVEICVPPDCPEIKVSRGGRKVKYDYGDYKVEILSKDGVVYVDYDD